MKCVVSPSALSGALSLVSKAVSGRTSLPVLGNVLLTASGKELQVVATNLDIAISQKITATVEEEGRTTVPARLLSDYVSSLDEAPCSLELDVQTQVLKLRCGVHKTNLHGIDAVEFPPLPQPTGKPALKVDATIFAEAIDQVVMAASTDESSPVLTGVLFQVSGDKLTLAATDRHRLAVKTLQLDVTSNWGDTPVIVPARHLQEVARAVNATRNSVEISLSEQRNQIFFVLGDVSMSSRLIDGAYPNYSQVIPSESTTTVSLPTEVLLRGAKTASVLARDAANPVRLRVGQGTLTLQAQTAEVGDDEAPLKAEVNGDDVQIAFNARYVLDALGVMDSDSVQLSFNGSLNPGVIRPVGRDDYLCIIMPVRIPG